jgi:hypothetical protein
MAYGTMIAWQRAPSWWRCGRGCTCLGIFRSSLSFMRFSGAVLPAICMMKETDRCILSTGGGIFIWEWLAFFFEIESFVFGRYHALHLHAACEGRRGVERHSAATTFAHLGEFPSFLLLAHGKLLKAAFGAGCFFGWRGGCGTRDKLQGGVDWRCITATVQHTLQPVTVPNIRFMLQNSKTVQI